MAKEKKPIDLMAAKQKTLLRRYQKHRIRFRNNHNHVMPITQKSVCLLRIHLRLSTILKTSNKIVYSSGFWFVKVCIFWKCIQYVVHYDKTQMLKKFSSDKINGTKYVIFFLSRAPAHHSFTFNLRFLYEVKHKVLLSKTLCQIFHFRFLFVFIKVYLFVQQNACTLWL